MTPQPPLSTAELRRAWRALRITSDFDTSMRQPAMRRVVEAVARARRARAQARAATVPPDAAHDIDD